MNNLRLTLRTLLSYLDDTLEPAQAKLIGQKIAESEQAQELIERIRQVTRRRRLTTPPAQGPGGMAPNTIAEYLDNEVTPEQAAEVEQICLASDVHLAEVAACHQILTLVLGEPATVPPLARQRMYGLVKGPEAIPFRKPPKTTSHEDSDLSSTDLGQDPDETLRLGMPFFRRDADWRNQLLLIGGGFLAACLLILALYLTFRGAGTTEIAERPGDDLAQVDPDRGAVPVPVQEEKKEDIIPVKPTPIEKDDPKPEPVEKKEPVEDKKEEPKVEPAPEPTTVPFGPPNEQVLVVGQLVEEAKQSPLLLSLEGQPEAGKWQPVAKKAPQVRTNRPLVSLPTGRSTVQLKNGVKLTLIGAAPEPWVNFLNHESRATLFAHDDLDLDLRIERGRFALHNTKDEPVRVRVRHENPTQGKEEYFDLTLKNREAEVLIDRYAFLPRNEPFHEDPDSPERVGPIAEVVCIIASGIVGFETSDLHYTVNAELQGTTMMVLSSARGFVEPTSFERPDWADSNPEAPKKADAKQLKLMLKMRDGQAKAREALARRLEKQAVQVALTELTEADDAMSKWLAVRSYGAIDELQGLLEALAREDSPELRGHAVLTLRYWLAQGRDHDQKLYAELRNKYKVVVARKVMQLLHGVTEEEAGTPSTYDQLIEDLDNPILPLRELSYFNLIQLAPQGQNILYSASADQAGRQRAQAQFRQLIPRGQLPPQPGQAQPMPPTKKK